MSQVVPSIAARHWLAALLVSLCSLLAVQPAEAAKQRSAQQSVTKKKTVSKKNVARKKTASKKKVAHRPAGAKKKVLAKAPRRSSASKKALAQRADHNGPLRLTASVAYVIDQETGEVLLGKNEGKVLPIASLTKLMSGMIIAEAKLPMDEKITIDSDDVDRLKYSGSRLRVGTELTRAQALHLALMSSENRATHALARTFPGGESAFVSAMNVKARQLGMRDTRYVEPTGLSSRNQSTAHDLALLAAAASEQPVLRRYSTSPGYRLATDAGTLQYVNSNRLVRSGTWDIALQKTGYISEAGQCLLMQAELAGRKLTMVFLDSASKLARLRDAERVRAWLRRNPELTAGHGAGDAGS